MKGDFIMNPDEVICSCLNVTRGMIQEAVHNGAKTLEEVQDATSVGTVCGACVEEVEKIIAELTGK